MTLEFVGCALLLSFSALLLRSFGWKGAPVYALLCSVMLLSGAFDGLSGEFLRLCEMANRAGISESASALIKITGVGTLFGLSSDAVRELGEAGIAKAVDMVGRVEIITLTLPFIEEVLEIGAELIG